MPETMTLKAPQILCDAKWDLIARDVALLSVDGSGAISIDSICQSAGITDKQLLTLLDIPKFQAMYKWHLERFKKQGDAAPVAARSRILASLLVDKIFRDIMSGTIEPTMQIKYLDILMKAAGAYTELKQQMNVQVNTSAAVNLPLPKGLKNPKLQHLERVDTKQ